jgi:DNA replication protein DnaC
MAAAVKPTIPPVDRARIAALTRDAERAGQTPNGASGTNWRAPGLSENGSSPQRPASHEAGPMPPRSCPGCGAVMDLGYHDGCIPVYAHAVTCQAFTDLVERENAGRLAAAKLALYTRQAELPARAGTLADFEPGGCRRLDADNRAAVLECRAFAAAAGAGQGFTLCGTPGAGKTTLIAALAGSLLAAGLPLLFVNVPEELEGLKGRWDELRERVGQMKRVRVLILDDVGRERPSAWTVDEVLYPVVNARERAGLPLLCTTNETIPDLRAAYEQARGENGERPRSGAAVVDRLSRSLAPWVPMRGESRRGAARPASRPLDHLRAMKAGAAP